MRLIAPLADAQLGAALRDGQRLVHRATAAGLAFALDELGDIAIPDPVAGRIDRAQLRALASLYLAADLESAGVIAAVEALAGLAAAGAVTVDLGGAEPLLGKWWRSRAERLSEAERGAFFARLFGTARGSQAADATRNFQFEDRMLDLCEALYKLDAVPGPQDPGPSAGRARARRAATALAQNLAEASTGVTAFMAGEITAQLKDAFAILGQADLRHGFGARDLWGVVSGIGRLGHRPLVSPQPYVRRGKAGMVVIAWLADMAGNLGGTGPLASPADPVVSAAADWLEATLSLGEGAAPPVSASAPPPDPASNWAAIGR